MKQTESGKKILLVPRIEEKKGGGHFLRSAAYIKELRQAGLEAFLFIHEKILNSALVLHLSSMVRINQKWIISSSPEKEDWSFIILDNFKSSETEYAFWTRIAPVIAIDEGGPKRDSFDFLIDILPGLSSRSKVNISSPSLLPLPENRRPRFINQPHKTPFKILSVFGAEDSASLGLPLAESLTSIDGVFIDVIYHGPGIDKKSLPPNIKLIAPFYGLKEELHQYDLVLTHYGLTAFEAIHARVPVLIASPTRYHEKLAKQTGFISLGTKNRIAKRIGISKKLFPDFKKDFMEKITAASRKISHEQGLNTENPQSLVSFIKNLDCRAPRQCPACGETSLMHPVKNRMNDRTYRRCKNCSTIYMLRLNPPPIEYTENYFFSDYKKQYGKTYLEDFPHLVEMGKERLTRAKELLKNGGKPIPASIVPPPLRVLDIGCAYGPFLQAAKEAEFEGCGIDPAEDAVKYVSQTLGIPSVQGFFPDINLPEDMLKDGFDIISLWYVVEHFEDPQSALEKISSWLKPGGVLAFSTPSGSGISARRNRNMFLDKSPGDHWTIWNPGKTAKILKNHNLKLRKIVVTGHHPERFPGINTREGVIYNIVYKLSKYFSLGDTFEGYASKA